MAWIDESAQEEGIPALLRSATPKGQEPDAILAVHGPKRASLEAHLALYRSAMRPTASLPAFERELIAVVVSDLNGCHY